MEIIRATTTAARAGACYVRIQAMARKHRIPLDVEFDVHDTPDTLYIVAVDDYLPVATCRLYPEDAECMMLGRVVVLPEYRRRGIGTLVVREAEAWARELGFTKAVVESRDNKIPFYESMGYTPHLDRRIEGETFTCYRMDKDL
jgi:GNAT superfamily N-acetyltransferase